MPATSSIEDIELPRFILRLIEERTRVELNRTKPNLFLRVLEILHTVMESPIHHLWRRELWQQGPSITWSVRWFSEYDSHHARPGGKILATWWITQGAKSWVQKAVDVDYDPEPQRTIEIIDFLDGPILNFALFDGDSACIIEIFSPECTMERFTRNLSEGPRSERLGNLIGTHLLEKYPFYAFHPCLPPGWVRRGSDPVTPNESNEKV